METLTAEASGASLLIDRVLALRDDGDSVPLVLTPGPAGSGEGAGQRRLAAGSLPAGDYSGIGVVFRHPPDGPAEGSRAAEDASRGPVQTPFPFTVRKGAAVVLLVRLEAARPAAEGRRPATLTVMAPVQPAPDLIGLATSRGSHMVTFFEKTTGKVFAIVPVDGAPAGLALDQGRKRAYVAVPGNDEILALGLLEQAIVARLPLRGGDQPVELALTPDGRTLLSANSASSTLSVIDAPSMVERARVQVGNDPRSVVVDRTGRTAWVLNAGSSDITVVDVPARRANGTVAVESAPIRAGLDRDGQRLYVVHRTSPYLTILETASRAILNRVFVGPGATAIKVDVRTGLIILARAGTGQAELFDPLTLLPVDTLPTGGDVAWFTIDSEGNNLLMAHPDTGRVTAIRLVGKEPAATVDAGAEPYAVAVLGER